MSGILAFDPGLSGGSAIRGSDGIVCEPMPVNEGVLDLASLVRWIEANRGSFQSAYVEQVSSMPGQGVASTFKFGRTYGALEGVLTALKIPYALVTPQKWKKVMLAGVEAQEDKKAMSAIAASRIFPQIDFRETERCRKPHSGMVEASLIAEYGWRLLGGS